MFCDQKGVRISLSEIHIKDIQSNVRYSVPIFVKNISKGSRSIRFYPPQSQKFNLKVKEHEKIVAPGLDHTAAIEFCSEDTNGVNDRLVITVDGDVIEIPIIVRPCEPVLSVDKEIDFGRMVMANKVVTKDIMIRNTGSQPGKFDIAYHGSKPLNIVPSSGVVAAKTAQILRVEYVVKKAHDFDETATVSLEGQSNFQMRIHGSVVRRSLELLHPQSDKEMSCIKMGPTYYGTDRLEAAILYNNSPEVMQFVTLLVEDTVGQESGEVNESRASECQECTNPLTSLIAMVPNQGTLGPYQKAPVFFRFSPRWKIARKAFTETNQPPPKQDFALFLRIQMVGGGETGTATDSEQEANSSELKQQEEDKNSVQIEVAITGSAVPVLFSVQPRQQNFGTCFCGDQVERSIRLHNRSNLLAANFWFPRIAHFSASPERGVIEAGENLDITLAFVPKQFGSFQSSQPVHIMGTVGDLDNPFTAAVDVISSQAITCLAVCASVTVPPKSKFNGGFCPLISNEVGINIHSQFGSQEIKPRMAMIDNGATAATRALGSTLHMTMEAQQLNSEAMKRTHMAFPNDRLTSIRPFQQGKEFRTILKRFVRYNYIDPDYAYTPEEAKAIEEHRKHYADSVHSFHKDKETRARDKLLQPFENVLDMGMQPGSGARGHLLKLTDIRPTTPPEKLPNQLFKLLSTKEVAFSEQTAKTKSPQGVFNAIPTTEVEKLDCKKVLTPQQLHQIVTGPSTVDFGRVCLRSVTQKELHICNNLNQFVHVVVDIGCRELRQSSPLSQVIAPHSKMHIPMIFDSNTKGKFQRNVSYTINGHHENHIIVLAEVVPVDLEVFPEKLDVHPTLGLPAEAGLRSVVTLFNRLNSPAEFSWDPIFKGNKTSFSICPRSGVVEEFSSLDCEVTFYPSFNAFDRGEFQLLVRGNGADSTTSSQSVALAQQHLLKCRAFLGTSHAFFVNRRVMFGHVPLNLTSVKTAILQNNGTCHAHFRVLNPNPFPGMTVLPLSGTVPVGGEEHIKISFLPTAERKLDCSVRVAIRGWKELELRIAGNVIQPAIDIEVMKFDFGGIFVGSKAIREFTLINRSATRTLVEFDLSRYRDFSIKIPDFMEDEKSRKRAQLEGIYSILVKGKDEVPCLLIFEPSEIASYDFHLPVHINDLQAPAAAVTPLPPTPQELTPFIESEGEKQDWQGPLVPLRPPVKKGTGPTGNTITTNNNSNSNKCGGKMEMVKTGNSKLDRHNVTASTSANHSKQTAPQPTELNGRRPMPNITPSRHVIATAIRQPLLLSQLELNFHSLYHDSKTNADTANPSKLIHLVNNLDRPLKWMIALSQTRLGQDFISFHDADGNDLPRTKLLWPFSDTDNSTAVDPAAVAEASNNNSSSSSSSSSSMCVNDAGDLCGILHKVGDKVAVSIRFIAKEVGKHYRRLPVILHDNPDEPYSHIVIRGRVPGPTVKFFPKQLTLTPTPLNVEISANFQLEVRHYNKAAELNFDLPDVKAEDGTWMKPLRVTFLESSAVKPMDLTDRRQYACRITFKADRPVNFNDQIFVSDTLGNRFGFSVVAAADNSILTTYPFLLRHAHDYHIVCSEGRVLEGRDDVNMSELGEAQLMPLGVGEMSQSRAPSTIATSSNFDVSNSSYEDSMTASEANYPSTPRDGAMVKLRSKQTTLIAMESGLRTNQQSNSSGGTAADHPADCPDSPFTTDRPLSSAMEEELQAISHRKNRPSVSSGSASSSASNCEPTPLSLSLGDHSFGIHVEDLTQYHPQVVLAVQRWFSEFGWSGGTLPCKLPDTFRSRLSRKEPTEDENRKEQRSQVKAAGAGGQESKTDAQNNADWSNSGAKAEQRTLYDMICGLSGCNIPGISLSGSLPPVSQANLRLRQIIGQHNALLLFLRVQGAAVAHISPQMLLDRVDYGHWLNTERQRKALVSIGGDVAQLDKLPASYSEEELNKRLDRFEALSKRAWTDLLLQIYKVFVLSQVTLKSFRNLQQPNPELGLPTVNSMPSASNCYSLNERILLAWLNHFYENYRTRLWPPAVSGHLENEVNNCRNGPPLARWIVNFDHDLMDGVVLAAVLGAHMPFLVETHLKEMYTQAKTAEQCLHNCLKIVNALKFVGLDFHIQALEMTAPHPIMLLMLTAYLYDNLPQYIPQETVQFEGALHGLASRQIKVNNPLGKPITYRCILAGHDSRDFALPKGDSVTIPGRSSVLVAVEFRSRFLRTAHASLLLVSRRNGPYVGSGMVFSLRGHVNYVESVAFEKLNSPCYFLKPLELRIVNPFPEAGDFTVSLVESESESSSAAILLHTHSKAPSLQPTPNESPTRRGSRVKPLLLSKAAAPLVSSNLLDKAIWSEKAPTTDHPNNRLVSFLDAAGDHRDKADSAGHSLLSFFTYTTTIHLTAQGHAVLPLTFLPFQVGRKHCFVRLHCPAVGEFLHSVEAIADLPLPTPVPDTPTKSNEMLSLTKKAATSTTSVRVSSAVAGSHGTKGDDLVVYWRCEIGKSISESLSIPIVNRQKQKALVLAAQQYLSEQEISRRRITGTLESSSLAAKALKMLTVSRKERPKKLGEEVAKKYDKRQNLVTYKIETSSTFFKAPETILIPDPHSASQNNETTTTTTTTTSSGKESTEATVNLPIVFQSRTAGVYPCDVIVKGPDDVRVHRIECMVVPEGSEAELHFHSPVNESLNQLIPLINQTASDWPLRVVLHPAANVGFSGPDKMLAKARTTSHYPLRFRPLKEGDVTATLELLNDIDGTRHVFYLKGRGKKPLAMDTVSLQGEVHESLARILSVPNTTRRKLMFTVETDLPKGFLSGPEHVTILPGRQVAYSLNVTPNKRGHFQGIVAFVAGRDRIIDYDSDGDEIPPLEEDQVEGHFRMWYKLEIDAQPGPPRQTLQLQTSCQRSTLLQIPLSNSNSSEAMPFSVTIEGADLTGDTSFAIPPAVGDFQYELCFTPSMVGNTTGSLIFFNEDVGEFWYSLQMTATPPPITLVDPVHCELGKWKIVDLELRNPCGERLTLTPLVTNTFNFTLRTEMDMNSAVVLEPHATLKVPVRFAPSELGFDAHNCRITFNSPQVSLQYTYIVGAGGTHKAMFRKMKIEGIFS